MKKMIFLLLFLCGCSPIVPIPDKPNGLYVNHILVKPNATYEDACDVIFNKRYPGETVELIRNKKVVLTSGSK